MSRYFEGRPRWSRVVRITVPVERTYPLADVAAAFGEFAGGTRGKIAITIG